MGMGRTPTELAEGAEGREQGGRGLLSSEPFSAAGLGSNSTPRDGLDFFLVSSDKFLSDCRPNRSRT